MDIITLKNRNQKFSIIYSKVSFKKGLSCRAIKPKSLSFEYIPSTGFSVPHFLEGQRESFKAFLKYGLIKELNLHGFFSTRLEDLYENWVAYNKRDSKLQLPLDDICSVIFYGEHYQLKKPRLTPKQAILKRKTYASQLFVPVEFIYHPTDEIFREWFLLANIPMMTKNGHFVVNGSPRMIMNQIVRRPGIYFKKILKTNQNYVYVADFIAQRGTWLRLEIDAQKKRGNFFLKSRQIWAKIKRVKKCPVTLLLSDLGLSQALFDSYIQTTKASSSFEKDLLFENNTFLNRREEMKEFLTVDMQMLPWPALLNSRKSFFGSKFTNPYTYSLSRSGRLNLNQTLGLNFPLTQTTLTPEDILLGCFQLIDFFHGSQKESDIDDLSNRKIRPTGELIQNQIGIGLLRLQEEIKFKLNHKEDGITRWFWKHRLNQLNKKKLDPKKLYREKKDYFRGLILSKSINSSLKEFFGTNALSQFLDQTNPLAELTHKRRLSSLGDGGINRDTAGMAIRGIHPSHYGRICPIETPEGQNAGLVNSFTAYAKLNSIGLIETPFYPIYKGLVLRDQQPYLFSPEQEKDFIIAPGDSTLDQFNQLPKLTLPVRQGKNFDKLFPSQMDFIAINPLQMISVATSLIPFLEHDDGNRALMGSNMQRQAVPTLVPSSPIVGTGFESKVIADSSYGLQARASGLVSYVDSQIIILYSPLSSHSPRLIKKIQTNHLTLEVVESKLESQRDNFFHFCESSSSRKNGFNDSRFSKKSFLNETDNQIEKVVMRHQKKNFGPFRNQKINYKPNKLAKMSSFGLGLQSFSLTTTQLHKLLNLNYDHELLSLWTIIFLVSKKIFQKTSTGFNSLIRKKTLTVLEQSLNESFFTHYCLLLLDQFFWAVKTSEALSENSSITAIKYKNWPNQNLNRFSFFMQQLTKTKKALKFQKNQMIRSLTTVNEMNQKKGFEVNNISFVQISPFFLPPSSRVTQKYLKKCFFFRKSLRPNYEQKLIVGENHPLKFTTPFILRTSTELTRLNFQLNSSRDPNAQLLFTKLKLDGSTNHLSKIRLNPLFKNKKNLIKTNIVFQKDLDNEAISKNISSHFITKKDFELLYLPLFQDELNLIQPAQPWLNSIKLNVNKQTVVKKSCLEDRLVPQHYELNSFLRSNQDTVLSHRPVVSPGQWVEKGDVLADNVASCKGELAIGQNLLVGYTPWDGYNFEDAVLMSQRVISEDLFTTIHIERYEVIIKDTQYGLEKITNQLPSEKQDVSALDLDGIIKIGTWVSEGDILVGKVTPLGQVELSPYEKLLYDIVKKDKPKIRDTSLRLPANVHGRVIHIEEKAAKQTSKKNKPFLIKNKRVASKLKSISKTQKGWPRPSFDLSFFKKRFENKNINQLRESIKASHLKMVRESFLNSIFDLTNDAMLFKHKKNWSNLFYFKQELTFECCQNWFHFGNIFPQTGKDGLLLNVSKTVDKKSQVTKKARLSRRQNSFVKIQVYVAERRKIQVGDKIAGRHGNKGIISAILPRQDMPYLPDGSSLDLVLNPLGVPSRMNVGQIFECLLGLAGSYLNQTYKIQPFDETYGPEASRSLVYSKLYEARLKTNQSWLFNPNYPGKVRLFDGRTGDCFEQPVTVGKAYILKLIHLVDEKIHARSTGPYSLVTQQPLRGRSSQGGQRVGEMEVWALEGFGAAYILQEILTVKSDDIQNRKFVTLSIVNNKRLKYGIPESFNLLMSELQCLCLKVVVGQFRKIPLMTPNTNVDLYNFSMKQKNKTRAQTCWPFNRMGLNTPVKQAQENKKLQNQEKLKPKKNSLKKKV